jgi:hypothetical protein
LPSSTPGLPFEIEAEEPSEICCPCLPFGIDADDLSELLTISVMLAVTFGYLELKSLAARKGSTETR